MAKQKVVNDSESGPSGQFLYGRSPFYGFADNPEGEPMDPDDAVNAMGERAAQQMRPPANASSGKQQAPAPKPKRLSLGQRIGAKD